MERRDNVRPFRPQRPPKRTPSGGLKTPRGQVLLLHALTIGAFGLFLARDLFGWPQAIDWLALAIGVAAIAIAASRREDGMPWARTHHEMGVRTLVIGAAFWTLFNLSALIPVIGGIGVYGILAVVAWVGVRAVAGLVRGYLRLPFANPRTPFI